MKTDSIACVVIWYNPDNMSVQNILTYNRYFKIVYVVDNSNVSNFSLVSEITNIVYIPNFHNAGIAAALNIGCSKAYKAGFVWCMTMDQDSSWEQNQLDRFFNKIQEYQTETQISFAPFHTNKLKSAIGDVIYKHSANREKPEFIYQQKVITSGNVIKLKIWKQIGGFYEPLFIDEVDHEFCYRLQANGYRILEFPNITMEHTLGTIKKTILPRPCKHTGIRIYYIFRNLLYIKKVYPQQFKHSRGLQYMIISFLQKIYEFKMKDIAYMLQGIRDACRNSYGEYKSPSCKHKHLLQ